MPDSINKIVTVIASALDREQDEPFKRLLAVKVDHWRSTLLGRSLEKHPEQRKNFIQTLWVPMECKPLIPCPVPIPLSNRSKSKFSIPDPLRTSVLFDYVGSIDGTNPFKLASAGTIGYVTQGRYSKNIVFYEYENKDIAVRSKKTLPMIRVDAIFDKPMDVMAYNCKSIQCDFWNEPYPATQDIIQMIVQYILTVDYALKGPNTPNVPEVEVNPQTPRSNP